MAAVSVGASRVDGVYIFCLRLMPTVRGAWNQTRGMPVMTGSGGLRCGLAAVAVLLALAACAPPPEIPAHMKAPAPANAVREVIRLVNAERAARGLRPLKPARRLMAAAQFHAEYMVKNDCYEHECPGGPKLIDRLQKAGYVSFRASENIHASPRTPRDVVSGWMNSPPHRANMLDPRVRHIGVGHYYQANDGGRVRYYHYWVANFGAGTTPILEAERGRRR